MILATELDPVRGRRPYYTPDDRAYGEAAAAPSLEATLGATRTDDNELT